MEPLAIPSPLIGMFEHAEAVQPWSTEDRNAWFEALRSVIEFVYPVDDAPQLALTDGTPKKPPAKKSGKRPYAPRVKWGAVIEDLLSGALSEFVCEKKKSGAPTIVSDLTRRYKGIIVDVEDSDDPALSTITVRIGTYRG